MTKKSNASVLLQPTAITHLKKSTQGMDYNEILKNTLQWNKNVLQMCYSQFITAHWYIFIY